MAVNEQIVTGRKFRKLVDETTKLWQRLSFWTKAIYVEFNDGQTAEEKVTNLTSGGAIKCIRVVSSLPSDDASHTDTLYIIPE